MLKQLFFIFVCLTSIPSIAQQIEGANYRCEGPFELSTQSIGFVNACWSNEPKASCIYAGSLYGGLWKGTKIILQDSSRYQWKNITDSWPFPGTGIAALAVDDSTNHRILYIGTHQGGNGRLHLYGNGILKSDNDGKSWKKIGPTVNLRDNMEVDYLKMCPANHQVMFARIGKKYFLTRDGWNTFDTIFPPLRNKDDRLHVADVEWKPGTSQQFYLSTRSESGVKAELFFTPDFGKTWQNLQHNISAVNIQMDVIHQPGMENLLFIAYAENGAFIQLYDGKNWSENKNRTRVFNGNGYWNMQFEVNEVDTSVMYLSMTQIAKSKNGGKSFETITEYLGVNTHADVRDLHLLQSSIGGTKDILLMANDGGISLSEEGIKNNKSWKNCNGYGLAITQFWGIGSAWSEEEIIAGGGQDNGLYTFHDGQWHTNISGIGDGYDVCISELNSEFRLGQGNSPTLHRSENAGKTWRGVSSPNSKAGNFRRPMLQDKLKHRVFLGHHQLFMMDNTNGKLDGAWIQKTNFPDIFQKNGMLQNNLITAIALNGQKKKHCLITYASPLWGIDSLRGKVYFTQDIDAEEPTWTDLTFALPQLNWREIYDLIPDELHDNTYYCLWQDPYSGFESEVIRIEISSQADTIYITDITGNLPKMPRSKLIMENNSSGNLYIATDSGIYFSNPRLLLEKKWIRFQHNNNPLPFCTIADLEINAFQNRLYIATYGRGLWGTPTAVTGEGKKIIIRKNTNWNSPMKIDGPLYIKKGKILHINAPVYISPYAKITTGKNAVIQLHQKKLLRQNDGTMFDVSRLSKEKNLIIRVNE